MTETERIRKRITERLLAQFPSAYIRKIPGGPFKRGLPDQMLSLGGRFLAIESKVQGGKPLTPLQLRELELVAISGGVALCAVFMKDKGLAFIDFTTDERALELSNRVTGALGASSVQTAAKCSIRGILPSASTALG